MAESLDNEYFLLVFIVDLFCLGDLHDRLVWSEGYQKCRRIIHVGGHLKACKHMADPDV